MPFYRQSLRDGSEVAIKRMLLNPDIEYFLASDEFKNEVIIKQHLSFVLNQQAQFIVAEEAYIKPSEGSLEVVCQVILFVLQLFWVSRGSSKMMLRNVQQLLYLASLFNEEESFGVELLKYWCGLGSTVPKLLIFIIELLLWLVAFS